MSRISKILLLSIFALTNFATLSFATDMSQGLQCPPGWNDNRAARGNDLIKQCISPNQDGAIELYAAPGQEVPLGALLDMWAKEMTQRRLPFQNFVSEVPGHVSGYPAVTRTYSGNTRDGNQFDSHLVASRYDGVNYVFQGFALKGHSQTWNQLRRSMNTWYYPGTQQQNAGNQGSGLPLGAGAVNPGNTPYNNQPPSHGNTPYANDPYANQQYGSNANQAATAGTSLPTITGTFLSEEPDFIGGKKQFRLYFFYDDGTYSTALKNTSGKVLKNNDRTRFRVKKTGNNFVVSSGGSCTEGYVTETEHNNITRFKSGCYTSAGRAMYFEKVTDGYFAATTGQNTASNAANAFPSLSGTFIAETKDYFGGNYYYRMYQFYSDGTFRSGNKSAKTGKIDFGKNKIHYKIEKSGSNFAIKGSKNYCTEGFSTAIQHNQITRFVSGCYTSGGKKMYFKKIKN
ncbi:hypothetical protein [Maridesulfovibrio sp.]|uniref:hypothetical protein n=1 Tax=Maridesulfovibrio sp. TaxID=2795000 RepID=UPI0039EEE8F9